MLLLVSLTEERTIYLALELDRSWTEMTGVNPLDGTILLSFANSAAAQCPRCNMFADLSVWYSFQTRS